MKIIKRGKEKVIEKKKSCYKCKSVLSFTSSDVELDRDGKYIVCPVCKSFIAVD